MQKLIIRSMVNTWIFITFFLFSTLFSLLSAAPTTKKTFIIHMNHYSKPHPYPTHHHWYQSLTSTPDSILYTYNTVFHGFAAHLYPEEAEHLKKLDYVLNVFEERFYTVQTTRTSQFLGLDSNFNLFDGRQLKDIEEASQDIIVGVLDTGIWPESESFDDTGYSEIPKRWKGKCKSTPDFDHKLCNKKLIGSRYFISGHEKRTSNNTVISSRDYNGHGTHCASTVVGSPVANVSLFGYAKGTARGVAVRARVANYKVCWTGCAESDILAGMEQAVLDGVDVLSISLGFPSLTPIPYFQDTFAIGAFFVMRKGIIVSCAAGNDGPLKSSLVNMAPWILTVGAASIDRNFPAYASLGNKQQFEGVSLYSGPGMGSKQVSLVYHKGSNKSSNYCLEGTIEPAIVRGKVVVCDSWKGTLSSVEKGLVVRKAGGVGIIYVQQEPAKFLIAESHLVPTVAVGRKIGDLIKEYVKTDPNPTALLSFSGTVVNVRPSPMVAWFSSRGPNLVTPQILKPDIIAPGVNILAAWPEVVSPSGLKEDNRIVKFNMISGTSMACPHVSGIAALLKAAYPTWSPSAIRSALMTTAYTVDNTNSPFIDSATGEPSNPWAHGSGHVDPKKAFSPGLVYDISTEEYIKFWCSLNYPLNIVQQLTENPNLTCSEKFNDPGELNYPSFSVLFDNKTVIQYSRELTNVGAANSMYKVAVTVPPAVAVTVKPSELIFKKAGDKQKYTVTFTAKKNIKPASGVAFGSIVWSNAKNKVSSPIAFTWM